MNHKHQLGPTAALSYVFAGRATFTLVSRKTGARFTYRVRASYPKRQCYFVHVLTGPDNETCYSYIGYFKGSTFIQGGGKWSLAPDAPSVKAFAWFARHLLHPSKQVMKSAFEECVDFWHEGACGRCGRALTVPESIERGIGPECWARHFTAEAA